MIRRSMRLFLIILSSTQFYYGISVGKIKYIVWDAGSTVTDVRKMGILKELGLGQSIRLVAHFGSTKRVRRMMFEPLARYGGPQRRIAPNEAYTLDEDLKPLPHFISDTWLCSRIPNKYILRHIRRAVAQWNPHYTVSPKQKELICRLLCTALSARVLGNNTYCPKPMLKLLHQCQNQGYTQYILSNFEKEAFERACRSPRNQELMRLIPRERMLISGECGMIKPHTCMFAHFLEKYRLDPQECLFIDDQIENVKKARNMGFQALQVQKMNYKKLAHDLQNIGIL